MNTVPEQPSAEGERVPLVSDYLTDTEIDRLAALLINLLVETEQVRIGSAAEARSTPPSPRTTPRTRRRSPSHLAKWEAAWQAEQAAEGER